MWKNFSLENCKTRTSWLVQRLQFPGSSDSKLSIRRFRFQAFGSKLSNRSIRKLHKHDFHSQTTSTANAEHCQSIPTNTNAFLARKSECTLSACRFAGRSIGPREIGPISLVQSTSSSIGRNSNPMEFM